MSEKQNLIELQNAFLALPPRIKEWLSSEQVIYLIQEINNRLGFNNEKIVIIPNLILRLAVKDLEALDFINELSHELGVSFQTAKSIAEDIEHKILKPIESDLRRDAGIDVKLIYFGKPSAQRAEPKLQEKEISPISPISPIGPISGPTSAKIEVEKTEAAPVPLETTRPISPPGTSARAVPLTGGPTEWEKLRRETKPAAPAKPIRPIGKTEEKPAEAATPFILHQEGITYQPSPAKTERPEPMLNIKVQNYYAESPQKAPPKPVAVQLEYAQPNKQPTTDNKQLINGERARVVHYNEMRTPLTNIGTPKPLPSENRIDLRKFTKPDGNTVDLRKKQ